MTSVLISSTSNVLKVPVIIAMDSRSLLTPFWLGTVLLIISFTLLTFSTSLNFYFPNITTKLVSNTIYERSKSSLTSLRGESLFSSSEKTWSKTKLMSWNTLFMKGEIYWSRRGRRRNELAKKRKKKKCIGEEGESYIHSIYKHAIKV